MSRKSQNCENNSPLKVAITGIDGAGKSTVTDKLALELGGTYRVARVSRPAFAVINGIKYPFYQRLLKAVDALHASADKTENMRNILWVNALHVALQGRVIEPGLIKAIKPDIVLTSRDYIIDPAVYASVYAPTYCSQNLKRKIRHMQRFTGLSFRDAVFLLTVSPEEAVQRIERRIAQEKLKPGVAEREKWRHLHENVATLGLLQQGYYAALAEVKQQSDKVQIEIVDTQTLDKDGVFQYILVLLQSLLSKDDTQVNYPHT